MARERHRYQVFDRSNGRCTEHVRREWGPILAAVIAEQRVVDGDALVMGEILKEAGFVFGRDFVIRRVRHAS